MGITELVFPKLKDDEKLRQQIFDEFQDISKRNLLHVPGVLAVYRAKVVEAHGPVGEGHRGFIPMLAWDNFENIKSFITSAAYPAFQQSLGPYMAGKPTVQIFSTEDTPTTSSEGFLSQSSYLQAFLFSRADGAASEAEKAWSRFTEAVTSAAPGDTAPRFHHGSGIRDEDESHLGLIGWNDLSALKEVNSDAKVKKALEDLQESLDSEKKLSTLTLEISRMT